MNYNYEKAKSEGIEKFKKGLCRKYHLNETIVCGHLSNGEVIPWSQDMIVSVFSSFAEKIKEGVKEDFLAKIDEITWNYDDVGVNELEKNTAYIKVAEIKEYLSDSQTIKE